MPAANQIRREARRPHHRTPRHAAPQPPRSSRSRRSFSRRVHRFGIVLVLLAVVVLAIQASGLPRRFMYPQSHVSEIEASAARHGVDPTLVKAIIRCESGWDEHAVSPVGAIGLMQVMPETAQSVADLGLVDTSEFDPNNLSDPRTNIEYGVAYLSFLQKNLSTQEEVIAAYNAGIGTVTSWLAKGPITETIAFPETQNYLARVTDAFQAYSQME